jgi:hypothetical protein
LDEHTKTANPVVNMLFSLYVVIKILVGLLGYTCIARVAMWRCTVYMEGFAAQGVLA